MINHNILQFLKTEFEKELFSGACDILHSKSPLRLNFFACAIRELSRHFLSRLSPDKSVKSCEWFTLYDPENPSLITRNQRVKYAIQGVLSDPFAAAISVQDIVEATIKEVGQIVKDLNKFTHVNEDVFDLDNETVQHKSSEIINTLSYFFESIEDAKEQMDETLCEQEVITEFDGTIIQTIDSLDCLASHYQILSVITHNIDVEDISPNCISYSLIGEVLVRLQYGSDGDMRRGDGYETSMSFPFTAICSREFENGKINYVCNIEDVTVDTDEFYGASS